MYEREGKINTNGNCINDLSAEDGELRSPRTRNFGLYNVNVFEEED